MLAPAVRLNWTATRITPGYTLSIDTVLITVPVTVPLAATPGTAVTVTCGFGMRIPDASVTRNSIASLIRAPALYDTLSSKLATNTGVILAGTLEGTPYQYGTRSWMPDWLPVIV